jgi:hypothetical protein
MVRYFFDVIADGALVRDEEGMILPNMDAAQREASQSLADLAREIIRTKRPPILTISVRTSEGPVCEASFQWGWSPPSIEDGPQLLPTAW